MSVSSVRCTAQNGQTEIQKHKEFNVPSLHVRTNQFASLTFKCTYEKKFYTHQYDGTLYNHNITDVHMRDNMCTFI